MEISNDDMQNAVQAHLLLLKTLSRSGCVKLVDTVPADVCISVAAGGDTTVHVDVTVSAPVISDYCCECFLEPPQNLSFPGHFLPNCFQFPVPYTMYSSGLAVLYPRKPL